MAQPAVYKRVWSIQVFIRLLTFAGWAALAMVPVTRMHGCDLLI